MFAAQRGPASKSSCRFASSQSDSASPCKPNLRRRSEMKYAQSRIVSSAGSAPCPAPGDIETFVFAAVVLFLGAAALFFAVDVRRTAGVFFIFISARDPPVSGGPPPAISASTVFFFFGTELIGVDDFNPFNAHRMIGKLFLGRVRCRIVAGSSHETFRFPLGYHNHRRNGCLLDNPRNPL